MKSEEKKKIITAYKERVIIGGIYAVKNIKTGKILLEATQDLAGSRNRFEFSKRTGSATSFIIQKDWQIYGPDCFTFEVLEEIKKDTTQTPQEFAEDIKTLKELWKEKFPCEQLY